MNRTTHANLLVRALTLAVTIIALSGCAAYHLRDAQNAFNEGSQLEWRQHTGTPVTGKDAFSQPDVLYQAATDGNASAASYLYANEALDYLLSEKRASLVEDNLLGTALTLKALCLWRLDDPGFRDVIASAEEQEEFLSKKQLATVRLVDTFNRLERYGPKLERYRDKTMSLETYRDIQGDLMHDSESFAEQLKTPGDEFATKDAAFSAYIKMWQLRLYRDSRRCYNALTESDQHNPEVSEDARKQTEEVIAVWEALPERIRTNPIFRREKKLTNEAFSSPILK